MSPTMHARQRMQQRAIPAEWIELLICFGVEVASSHGVDRLALSHREAEQLRRRLKGLLNRWDHLVDACAVVSRTGTLVTATHKTTKPRRAVTHRPTSHGDL